MFPFFSKMETGASPAGRDENLLQFSACREQILECIQETAAAHGGKVLTNPERDAI